MDNANLEDRIAVYRILVGYLIAIILSFVIFSTSDIVNLNPPYTLSSITQMVAGIGSLFLSFALVWHYRKQTKVQEEQTKIQKNQEKIMEMQYRPRVSAGISLRKTRIPILVIKNIGNGAAMRVDADWEIAGKENSWTTAFLSPGESVSFPLFEERGEEGRRYVCEIDEAKEKISNSDSQELVVNLTYQNIRHEGRDSTYTLPLLKRLERLENSAVGAEQDGLAEIASELSQIRYTIDDRDRAYR